MNELVPGIGDFVLHQRCTYYGKVIGYGERQTDAGHQLTLKVEMPSQLVSSRVIVVEDFASQWLQKTEMEQIHNLSIFHSTEQ